VQRHVLRATRQRNVRRRLRQAARAAAESAPGQRREDQAAARRRRRRDGLPRLPAPHRQGRRRRAAAAAQRIAEERDRREDARHDAPEQIGGGVVGVHAAGDDARCGEAGDRRRDARRRGDHARASEDERRREEELRDGADGEGRRRLQGRGGDLEKLIVTWRRALPIALFLGTIVPFGAPRYLAVLREVRGLARLPMERRRVELFGNWYADAVRLQGEVSPTKSIDFVMLTPAARDVAV